MICSLTFLALTSLAAQQDLESIALPPGIFEPDTSTPSRLVVRDPEWLFERMSQRHSVILQRFPVPRGVESDLVLHPVSVLAEGAEAVVMTRDGSHRLRPSVHMFQGSVPGRNSHIFLAVSETRVNGYLKLEAETFWLVSEDHQITNLSPFEPPSLDPSCQTSDIGVPPLNAAAQAGGPAVRTADVFLELDPSFRGLFDSDQEALDYAVTIVGAASEVYRRDLGVLLCVPDGYLRLWTTTPPWGFSNLGNFRRYWISDDNPLKTIPRAAVHLFKAPVNSGAAWRVGGLCDDAEAYGFSDLGGDFRYPFEHTSTFNWDLLLFCHELGHTFGAFHAPNYGIPCDDGSGPDKGTIMGQCYVKPNGQVDPTDVGIRFHAVIQERLRELDHPCLEVTPIALGDYDASGTRDHSDLARLDAYLLQGFESAGCRETFDMNQDGTVDACDRQILAGIVEGYPLTYTSSPLVRGEATQVRLTGAQPGELVRFLVSESGEGCGPCLPAGCLDIQAPLTGLAIAIADSRGEATITFRILPDAPIRTISSQAIILRGPGGTTTIKSNPVTRTID
ncbi:MAG: M12 family metallo-peptidase [Planctomycetota bacterium]